MSALLVRLLCTLSVVATLALATSSECLGVPDGGSIRIAIDPYAAQNFTAFIPFLNNQSAAPTDCSESAFPLGLNFPWYTQACTDAQDLLRSALNTTTAFPNAFVEYVRVSKSLLPGLNASSYSLNSSACDPSANQTEQIALAKETLPQVAALMNITSTLLGDLRNASGLGHDVREDYMDMRSAMFITDYTYWNYTLWNCTLSLNNTVDYLGNITQCTQAIADIALQSNRNLTAIDNFVSQWNFEGVLGGVERYHGALDIIVKDVAKQQYNFNYTIALMDGVVNNNRSTTSGCIILAGVYNMLKFEMAVIDAYWAFLCKYGFV